MFGKDGNVVREGEFREGEWDEEATRRKRRRLAYVSACSSSDDFPSLPLCPVCMEEMVEGDELYVYSSCGHRVCACGKETLDSQWDAKCVVCKAEGGKRIRLF